MPLPSVSQMKSLYELERIEITKFILHILAVEISIPFFPLAISFILFFLLPSPNFSFKENKEEHLKWRMRLSLILSPSSLQFPFFIFLVLFYLHGWKIFHNLLKFPWQDLSQFDFWQLSFCPCTSWPLKLQL